MPILDNIKDEALAQAYVNHPTARFNKTQSYLTVHPDTKYDSARTTSPGVFAKLSIRERILEIMRENGLSEVETLSRLRRWQNDENNPAVSMDAVKTSLKLFGVFDEQINNFPQEINVQIVSIGEVNDAPIGEVIVDNTQGEVKSDTND